MHYRNHLCIQINVQALEHDHYFQGRLYATLFFQNDCQQLAKLRSTSILRENVTFHHTSTHEGNIIILINLHRTLESKNSNYTVINN